MIKKICACLVIILILVVLCMVLLPKTSSAISLFGNKQWLDLTYQFTHATIYAPDGSVVVEGKVDSWRDFEDGDQIQVTINDVTYLTHSSLVILSTK